MRETRCNKRLRKLHNDGSRRNMMSFNTAALRVAQHAMGLGEKRNTGRIYIGRNEG
jgi:hypothetical protein